MCRPRRRAGPCLGLGPRPRPSGSVWTPPQGIIYTYNIVQNYPTRAYYIILSNCRAGSIARGFQPELTPPVKYVLHASYSAKYPNRIPAPRGDVAHPGSLADSESLTKPRGDGVTEAAPSPPPSAPPPSEPPSSLRRFGAQRTEAAEGSGADSDPE